MFQNSVDYGAQENKFCCTKPSKDTREQRNDQEQLGVIHYLMSQPCSPQISYTWLDFKGPQKIENLTK